jgi:Epoxide hydrolase N terminus
MDTVKLPDEGRRSFLSASAAAGAASLLPAQMALAAGETAIHPFRVNAPDADLADLRKRIAATRWPEREQVPDATQGVQLATMQRLAQYWANEHDWRKCEAKINAVPNFITEIDGLDIHFIHVRSIHENALPMIVTHGWPGSIIEHMKTRANRRGDGAAQGRRADHGDRVDQQPANHFLRRRRLDPARAGVDRHHGTRDARWHLRRHREGQRPPLEPL